MTGDKVNEDYIVNYVYQDFEVSPKNFFGDRQAIRLAGVNTRQVNINFKRVMFSDGTVLSFDKTERFDIPQTTSVESLELELRSEIDSTIKNLPEMINDHEWICCCGRVNIDETFCVRCGREKEKQLEELSLSHLKQLVIERQEREEQLQKEQEEQAQFHKEKIQQILKKTSVIFLSAVLGVIVLGVGVVYLSRGDDLDSSDIVTNSTMSRIQYRVTDNESYLENSGDYLDVKVYAESIVSCEGQCESKYMTYEEAVELVERASKEIGYVVYEEWWNEHRSRIPESN